MLHSRPVTRQTTADALPASRPRCPTDCIYGGRRPGLRRTRVPVRRLALAVDPAVVQLAEFLVEGNDHAISGPLKGGLAGCNRGACGVAFNEGLAVFRLDCPELV